MSSRVACRALAALLVACVLALVPTVSLALDGSIDSLVPTTDEGPSLLEAQAAIVVDAQGDELWGTNEHEHMPMASITKVMTAMVALDSGIDLDERCPIQDVQLEEGSQVAGYTSSDAPTFGELLRVMLVYSANDAAENVALHVAGSEQAFVERMNEKAQELGMADTHFQNPHGLEADGHYSCASDLVTMGRYALEHYPLIAQTVRRTSVTATIAGHQVSLHSTDSLMGSYPGMLGIKTGAVQAGTAFLGALTREGTRIYTCVLGCQTSSGRFTDTQELAEWAYDHYRESTFATPARPVAYVAFADHFGLVCPVRAIGTSRGMVWPEDGPVMREDGCHPVASAGLPGALWRTSAWSQGSRIVARATYALGAPAAKPAHRPVTEAFGGLEGRIAA